jgi:hypothetical protein
MTGLEVARGFVNAVRERDADAAAELCIEAVEVILPGADAPQRGKEGVRQMIRMAPQFLQGMRDEEERDGEVRITTLTRAPACSRITRRGSSSWTAERSTVSPSSSAARTSGRPPPQRRGHRPG